MRGALDSSRANAALRSRRYRGADRPRADGRLGVLEPMVQALFPAGFRDEDDSVPLNEVDSGLGAFVTQRRRLSAANASAFLPSRSDTRSGATRAQATKNAAITSIGNQAAMH